MQKTSDKTGLEPHSTGFRLADLGQEASAYVRDEIGLADHVVAAVLFTDVARSTRHSSNVEEQPWPQLLCAYRDIVRRQAVRYNGSMARSGDGTFVWFTGAYSAIRCALAVQQDLCEVDLDLRGGLHAGEIDLRDGDNTVVLAHVASRICGVADAGRVFASQVFGELAADVGLVLEAAGTYQLDDVPGEWNLLAVNG